MANHRLWFFHSETTKCHLFSLASPQLPAIKQVMKELSICKSLGGDPSEVQNEGHKVLLPENPLQNISQGHGKGDLPVKIPLRAGDTCYNNAQVCQLTCPGFLS